MIFLILSTALTGLAGAVFHRLPFLPWYISYSDVWKFFRVAKLEGWPYVDFSVEYPVLTGIFIKIVGLFGFGNQTLYYGVSVFLLVLGAAIVTFLLFKIEPNSGRRILLYWALAPSIFVFLTANWDILAVLPAVAALYFASRGKFLLAASLLAVGASAKFYPVIYLLSLVFLVPSWLARVKAAASFALIFAAINAPFMLANFEGWRHFWLFNSAREPNFDSIWTIFKIAIPELSVGWINGLSLLIFISGIAFLWRRLSKSSLLYACLAVTLLFLITNKVFSPQYILWLLPLFVLTDLPGKSLFYALEAANLTVFFFILAWQDSLSGGVLTPNALFWIAAGAVLIRHAVLTGIFIKTISRAKNATLDYGHSKR